MKKQLLAVSLWTISLVLLCLLGGCKGAAPPPDEAAAPAPVQAQAAKKLALGEWTDLLGTTQPLPNHSARISAAVEGRVLSVLGDGKGSVVVEGQQVKTDQVIVRLDDRVPRANRAKLHATLDDLEEQQKQAGYALDLATIDVTRLKGLLRTSSPGSTLVSQVELDKAQVLQKDAQSKIKAMAARLTAAQAELKALDGQLEFFTLRAPISGRLSIVQAVPGQTLNPGAVVAEVLDLRSIDVLCYVPPDAATRLAEGQSAKLIREETTTPEDHKPLLGKVAFIGVQAQAETGNIPVKVRFPNPDFRLRAHAIVRVNVLTKPEQERLTIPEAALVEDQERTVVFGIEIVTTEKKGDEEYQVGKARKLFGTLGIRDRERHVVELLSIEDAAKKETLDPSTFLFVTEGGNGLQNGDTVRIQKATPDKEHK